jgi:hypothetical protein
MAVMYADYFVKNGEQETYDFVFGTSVALSVLNSLYTNFINEGIEPMETIPKEKKEKYWTAACKYYETLGDRLKASRSCYVLELITSTF